MIGVLALSRLLVVVLDEYLEHALSAAYGEMAISIRLGATAEFWRTEMALAPAMVLLTATVLSVWLCRQIDWRRNSTSQEAQTSVKILYVLESEGAPEWQAIPAKHAAVSWVGHLQDRLTISFERPQGEDLTVRFTGA